MEHLLRHEYLETQGSRDIDLRPCPPREFALSFNRAGLPFRPRHSLSKVRWEAEAFGG